MVLTSLLPVIIAAQVKSKKISGKVTTIQNDPVANASVSLLNAIDSAAMKNNVADKNGNFEFTELEKGTYLLTITSIGNNKYTSPPMTVDEEHPDILLPVIILIASNNTTLKEVIVTAKMPLIIQDIDRTVVNVDAMIGTAGSNALEVLEKTPGVTVSSDGAISLNGNGGVLLLLDGRSTYMSGQDLAAYLKSLPAAILDKIELMTNPPAKYDASGSSVINIRLKKNTRQGFNGNISASYSQGVELRDYAVMNLNYRYKKMNIFGNMGYSKDGNYSNDTFRRYFYNPDGSMASAVLIENDYKYKADVAFGKIGMDYAASPNTTYGIIFSGMTRPKHDRLDYTSNSYDGSMHLDSTGTGFTDGNYKWHTTGINVNFQHKFDKIGKEITTDFYYVNYDANGDQQLPAYTAKPDGTILSSNEMKYLFPSRTDIYTAKTDYVHPFKGKARLEAGLKSSWVHTNNIADYFTVNGSGIIPDYDKTNQFIYWENINSAYVSARNEWKRFGVQVGVRIENTRVKGYQAGNRVIKDSSFNRTYTGIFPTVYLSYKLDSVGSKSIVLSYGRRLNRPNYQQLNPFLLYRDKYSYTAGNPYLDPTYNYHLELNFRYKQYFGIGVLYDHVTDIIFQATENINNVFITRPENLNGGYMIGVAANLSFSFTKWWNFNFNATLANVVNAGKVYTENLNQHANIARLNLLNQFRFNKGWSAEVFSFYGSKMIAGQLTINSRYRVNAAAQKKILKDKGSLKLTIDDIFHSWKQNDITLLKQTEAFHFNETDTQRIGLSFSYSFGKEAFARKRRYTDNGADSEKSRVD